MFSNSNEIASTCMALTTVPTKPLGYLFSLFSATMATCSVCVRQRGLTLGTLVCGWGDRVSPEPLMPPPGAGLRGRMGLGQGEVQLKSRSLDTRCSNSCDDL